mgnify:FL=1
MMTINRTVKSKLAYILASLFAVWHTGALIIAPAPESYLINSIYSVYKPYLSLFNINNGWAFFAPNPHTGVRMHYNIVDGDGHTHRFDFTGSLQRSATVFQRYTMMQDYISLKAAPYTASAGLYLCRRHADLQPQTIRFEFHRARVLTPEQFLAGQRATDADNLIIEMGDPISCQP